MHCRKSPITLPYTSSLAGSFKAIAVVSGFLIESFEGIVDPANNAAFGFGMTAQTATATGINADIYVYGRAYLKSISSYYISYE